MKEIVQLDKQEYENLVAIARLNDEDIIQKAQDIYREKGTYSVRVRFDYKYNDYYSSRTKYLTVTPDVYTHDWDKEFFKNVNKNEISEVAEASLKEYIQDNLDSGIKSVEDVLKIRKEFESKIYRYFWFSCAGWAFAIILFTYILTKL